MYVKITSPLGVPPRNFLQFWCPEINSERRNTACSGFQDFRKNMLGGKLTEEGHWELGNVEENVAGMANFDILVGREVGFCCAMF